MADRKKVVNPSVIPNPGMTLGSRCPTFFMRRTGRDRVRRGARLGSALRRTVDDEDRPARLRRLTSFDRRSPAWRDVGDAEHQHLRGAGGQIARELRDGLADGELGAHLEAVIAAALRNAHRATRASARRGRCPGGPRERCRGTPLRRRRGAAGSRPPRAWRGARLRRSSGCRPASGSVRCSAGRALRRRHGRSSHSTVLAASAPPAMAATPANGAVTPAPAEAVDGAQPDARLHARGEAFEQRLARERRGVGFRGAHGEETRERCRQHVQPARADRDLRARRERQCRAARAGCA